jgi:cell division protein FtsQ
VAGGNRRRIDVQPGERRRKLARLAILAAPTAGVLAGWLGWSRLVEGDTLRIREVRFVGANRARPEELAELCPVKPGDHLALVDVDLVARALVRHPWVASVDVRRVLPPALEVRVTERRAVALVDLGGLYLVDDRAEVFKKAMPGDGLDLPVVTGISREDWLGHEDEMRRKLLGALALLDRWAERRLDRREPVSQIHLDPQVGTTVWAGEEGVEVRLGQGDIPDKLARLERVLAAIHAEGRRAEVMHLDNRRRPDWVAVRFDSRSAPETARR